MNKQLTPVQSALLKAVKAIRSQGGFKPLPFKLPKPLPTANAESA